MGDARLWTIIGISALACYTWRGLGVALSGRVRPRDPIILWVTCVAYAMLAGAFIRMIVLPTGGLAASPPDHRLLAGVAALAMFFGFRRNVMAGTATGVAAMIALAYWGRPLFTL